MPLFLSPDHTRNPSQIYICSPWIFLLYFSLSHIPLSSAEQRRYLDIPSSPSSLMDLFRSDRLEYHSFNSPEDDDFFHSVQSDPVAFTNSCASLIRPMDRQFTENIKKHLIENSLLFVVICRTTDDSGSRIPSERIGTLFLKSPSPDMAHHRCSEFGIDIKKEYQTRGYGGEAIDWMLDWAFKNAGLHRVECNVFGWNTRAHKIYQRLGFREEGRRRECLFKDDQWWDEVHLGILKEEWRKIRQDQATV